MRYIELNPVRAAMVEDPAHYRWTSYRANALGHTSPLLVPHPVYLALGAVDKVRRVAYRGLFRHHLDDETLSDIRLALNQSQPLDNERFYAKIARMTGAAARGEAQGPRFVMSPGKQSRGRESWNCEKYSIPAPLTPFPLSSFYSDNHLAGSSTERYCLFFPKRRTNRSKEEADNETIRWD